MTEREKKQAGLLYYADDPVLRLERMRSEELCFSLNQLPPSKGEERKAILRELLGTLPETYDLLPPFQCDYGYNIHIGENCFINYRAVILDCAPVYIGKQVFIGPSLSLYTVNHPMNPEERAAGKEYALPVTIEDHVWIGGNVTILAGVTIGRGSVIGAGSLVHKSIPKGVFAAGNPCRVIRPIDE